MCHHHPASFLGKVVAVKALQTAALLAASAALYLLGFPDSSRAQMDECLRATQTGAPPSAWERIKNYFVSLGLAAKPPGSRYELIRLRAELVSLEADKQELIHIISERISGSTPEISNSEASPLSRIPGLLSKIGRSLEDLQLLAEQGNMFAAEPAFKDLKINLQEKRAYAWCQLAHQMNSSAPNISEVTNILDTIRKEAEAISSAEDALAQYIKTLKE